jgi:SAM-dependent methyltransferase
MNTACPLCHKEAKLHAIADDIEYFTSDRRFEYRHCDSCNILFVSPMLADRLPEIYPSNYYSFVAGGANIVQKIKHLLDRQWMSGLTRQIQGKALSVLDVGGGNGSLLDLVKASDPRVTFTQVVDIDAGAADVARAAGHHYALTPFEHFETDRRYDLILMLNMIEHVAQPDRMLTKAKELLSPSGVIVIKTPNFDALDARIFRHRSWAGFHAPRHFVLFTKDSFLAMARACGLATHSFSYTQGAPFWSVSVANELRRLGLIKASRAAPLTHHPLVPYLQALFAAFDFARRPVSKLSQMMIVLRRD